MNRITLILTVISVAAMLAVGCDKITTPKAEKIDDIDISGITIIGGHHNGPRDQIQHMKITARIKEGSVRHDKRDVFWVMETAPVWRDDNSGVDKGIDGRLFVIWKDGGKLYGGHFDWKRRGNTLKNYHTIRPPENYLGRYPVRGQPWWLVACNNEGTERSNVVRASDVW